MGDQINPQKAKAKGIQNPPRVLQMACVDIAVKNLLLPLMRELRHSGFQVECAAADLGTGTSDLIRSNGFPFHPLAIERNLSPLNIVRAFRSIHALLKRGDYDLVHLHTPLAAFIGRLAAKTAGIPRIFYTAHGFYFHDNMPPFQRGLFELLEYAAGRVATDILFCQSREDTDQAVRKRFLHPSRIFHIGNGVDTDRFKPAPSLAKRVRGELGIPLRSVVVTFIGRVVKEKGVLDLARAYITLAERHPNSTLLVIGNCSMAGDRDRSTVNRLKLLIDGHHLDKRIKLLGFRNDIERILAASDIFVLPSYREGLPRSICEAMACALPVIATDIRGCREELIDGETGYLFAPGDVSSLERKLEKLMTERGKRILMGEKGRRRVERFFDEKLVLNRQIAVYRDALQLQGRLPGIPPPPIIKKTGAGRDPVPV